MSLTFPSFTFSWLSLFPHRPPRAVLFPSSFLEGFPPSSSFVFSFFFPLFTIVFRLLSFFLLKIRNNEKKTFLLRFSFSFLLVEKKERKKRKRVRSVLGGMRKMMLLGWDQNNQKQFSRWYYYKSDFLTRIAGIFCNFEDKLPESRWNWGKSENL